MLHMSPYKMAGSLRTTQRKLASQSRGGNDARQPPCVVTWVGGVRAANTKHLEHGGLGFQDGSAAEGADFEGRH